MSIGGVRIPYSGRPLVTLSVAAAVSSVMLPPCSEFPLWDPRTLSPFRHRVSHGLGGLEFSAWAIGSLMNANIQVEVSWGALEVNDPPEETLRMFQL